MNTTYTVSSYTIYEFGQRTDANGQPHQEDALYPVQGKARNDTMVFVVCDGMGGHEAGEVASAVVSRAAGDFLTRAIMNGEPCTDTLIEDAITLAYDALDIACPDDGNPRKPGTTLALLVLHQKGFTLAHMGDSRIYLFRPGRDSASTQILHRTKDHSLVNDLVDCGVITPEEALTSPQRNVITRAVQPHQPRLHPTIYNGEGLQPGDCFYLCTDGMLERITDDQLRGIFSEAVPDTMTRTNMLREESVNNSDNHSAYVVRIDTVNGESGTPRSEAASPETTVINSFENLTSAQPPVESQNTTTTLPERPTIPPSHPVSPQPAVSVARQKAPTVMGARRPVKASRRKGHTPTAPNRHISQTPPAHPSGFFKGNPHSWLVWVIGAAVAITVLLFIAGYWIYFRD